MRTKMIVLLLAIFGAIFYPVLSLNADVKITHMSGSVEILKDGSWQEAKVGIFLSSREKIKTNAQSRAILLDGESKIFVRENSEIEITKSTVGRESVFSLLAGKIRAKVKLMQGSKFRVNTPVAVASVRGTDFALYSSGELLVFEGVVEYGDKVFSKPIIVEDGYLAKLEAGIPVKRTPTVEEMETLKEEWDSSFEDMLSVGEPEGKATQKLQEAKEEPLKENELLTELQELKQELREMVREVKADIIVTRDLTNEIKQADIASGRTLTDRYGNLVRVEQQLLRPQPDTVQFVNITKRDSYRYNGYFQNEYKGSSGARIDIIDKRLTFSEKLPDSLGDWPKFFSQESVKLNRMTFSMRNGVDEIRTEANRNTQTDEMEGKTLINGWKIDENYESISDGTGRFDSDEDIDVSDLWFWTKSPEFRVTKDLNNDGQIDDNEKKYLSIWTEFYGINNSGAILTKDSFTAADSNPFKILKEIAFQSTIFIKEVTPPQKDGVPEPIGDFLSGRNFDFVVIPDILMNVMTKIGSQISGMGFKSSGNSRAIYRNPLNL